MKAKCYGLKINHTDIAHAEISVVVDKSALQNLPAQDKPMEIVLQTIKKKRSLSANAYCWVLFDEIAKAIKNTAVNVYKAAIRDVGVYELMYMPIGAVDRFIDIWNAKGDGWQAELLEAEYQGLSCVKAFYGSSTYNTSEMTRLIDWAIDEAEELGIETLTPDQKNLLLQEWENR